MISRAYWLTATSGGNNDAYCASSNQSMLSTQYTPWRDNIVSPFAEQLHSNYAAPLPDIPLILEILSQANTEMENMDSHIAQAEVMLEHLRTERNNLTVFIRGHRRLICPFLRVPSELWAEIFRFACNDFLHDPRDPADLNHPHRLGPGSLNSANSVLIISRVCSDWRRIMESLPDMWARPLLNDCWPISPAKYTNDFLGFLDTKLRSMSHQLRLSGDKPLHVTLSTVMYATMNPTVLIYPALLLLAQQHHRLQRLDIYGGKNLFACGDIAFTRVNKIFPELQELNFRWWYPTHSEEDLPKIFAPGGLPKLRVASFERKYPDRTCIPWQQLERVRFISIPTIDLHIVVPSMVRTRTLEILRLYHPDVGNAVREYTLSSLHSLKLKAWDHALSNAKFPSLRTLDLAGDWMNDWILADGVMNLITRSRCQITELTCGEWSAEGESDNILSCLLSMPCLQTLNLLDCFGDFSSKSIRLSLLKWLSLTRDTTDRDGDGKDFVNFPELRTLRIHMQLFMDSSLTSSLVDMVEARWKYRKTSGFSTGLGRIGGIPPPDTWQSSPDVDVEQLETQYERLMTMVEEGLEMEE